MENYLRYMNGERMRFWVNRDALNHVDSLK